MEFKKGKTVYTLDGLQAEFIGIIDGSFLVSPLMELQSYDELERVNTAPIFVEKIYADPPVGVYNEKINELSDELLRLENEKDGIISATIEAQKEHVALLAKLKKYEPLKNIEQIIDGDYTHVIIEGWSSLEIRKIEDLGCGVGSGKKLIVLYGRSKGDLTWQLNQYSDGSGSNQKIHMCLDEDDAKETLKSIVAEKLSSIKVPLGENVSSHHLINAVKLAVAHGVDIPENIKLEYAKKRVLALEVARKDSAKEQARIDARISKLEKEMIEL